MRLFDFVQKYDRIGLAAHGLRQLASLVIADVSRRCSDQSRHAVTFLILAHVDASHHRVVVEQELGQRFGQLGFADARRAEEDERADGFARVVEPRPRTPHGIRNGGDGLLLTDDPFVEFFLHVKQFFAFGGQHPRHGNPRPARNHLGDVLCIDFFLNHRIACRCQFVFLLQGPDLLFGLLDAAVADFGHLAVIALPFGLLRLDFQLFDAVFVCLNLFQQVALSLPLGPHRRIFGFQFVDFTRELLDALGVLFAADGLAFDFQLAHLAVERIDLLGHGVHLQPQS